MRVVSSLYHFLGDTSLFSKTSRAAADLCSSCARLLDIVRSRVQFLGLTVPVVIFFVSFLRIGRSRSSPLRNAFNLQFNVTSINKTVYSDCLSLGSAAARGQLVDIFTERFERNETLLMSWLGGSVTYQGHMIPPLQEQLAPSFPGVVMNNYGIPATGPQYFSYCLDDLLGNALFETAIFVLEFSVNDFVDTVAGQSFEVLLSTLLRLPQRPAVLLYVHSAPRFLVDGSFMGDPLSAPQQLHWDMGVRYGLPAVRLAPLLASLPSKQMGTFFKDPIHPNAEGGRLIAHLFLHLFGLIAAAPLPAGRAARDPSPLPPSPRQRQCWTTVGAVNTLVPAKIRGDWAFVRDTSVYVEGKNGWASEMPGASMTVPLTHCTRTVLVYYLSSYEEDMGTAEVFVPGCMAEPLLIDALWTVKHKITAGKAIELAEGCAPGKLKLTTRARGGTGGSRFKLIAIACE